MLRSTVVKSYLVKRNLVVREWVLGVYWAMRMKKALLWALRKNVDQVSHCLCSPLEDAGG